MRSKHIIFAVSVFILLFLFCSCIKTNTLSNQTTTTQVEICSTQDTHNTQFTTGGIVDVDEHVCENCNTIVGMEKEDFEIFVEKYDVFKYMKWMFWKDENGNHCIAELSSDYKTINKAHFFLNTQIIPTKENFESITYGMDMFDVVEKVGIPFRSVTSGLATLDFLADDGTVYRVNISSKDRTVIEVVVAENAPQTPEPQISIDLADEQHDCEVCNAIEKMTFEEFKAFIAEYEYLVKKNIYFWKDENGRNYVADVPYSAGIENKVMCFEDKDVKYSKGAITDDVINNITIFDLVKNFGIPRAVPFTGLFCLDFISDNGIEYRFTIKNLGNGNYKVGSVHEGDLPKTKQIEGSDLMLYINVADEQHDCEVCNAIEKMTKDEIRALEDKYDGLSRGSYFFWKDENGRNCVVYSSSDRSRAVKAMCFEDEEVKYGKGVITTDMLYGMTVFDIVKNFGIPVEIPKKSSSVVMYFASDDALTYRIAFANFFEYHMAWGVTEVEQQAE